MMPPPPDGGLRITLQTRLVLKALVGGRELYGLDLCDRTRLPSGTIYPILARLERARWVESFWEDPEKHEAEHRPRRRYYRLTPGGRQLALDALATGYRAGRKVRPAVLGPGGNPA
jgi:PadR family transcriptional regulator, regulatory protein PadR